MKDCPPDDDIQRFIDGALADEERARLETHVASCAACAALLATLGDALVTPSGRAADATADPVPGQTIGRYVLLERVGSGAMGSVFAAYDPQLDRRVALKLLRPGQTPEHARRMVREARLMARLSHPNVVAVHDAGELDGQVFIAMDFVTGSSLSRWLATAHRKPAEIVEVFLAAGRGLVAAHGAGIVHRDFKPDNVLVADDGRVLVTDFGLARADDDPSPAASAPSPSPASSPEASALVGTPAYMAPEQRRGERTDARADTWSFCVSLWRALYGALPDVSGPLVPRPLPGVGRGVTRALAAGLVHDRALRAPLADVLRSMTPGRTRGLVVTAATLGAIAIAATVVMWPRAAGPCGGAATRLAGVWDDDARARIATAAPPPVARELDRYAARWASSHEAACVATRVEGTVSESTLDRRMACLDVRRGHLAALVDVLASGATEQALLAVSRLPDVADCDNLTYVASPVPPPAASEIDAVERVRAGLRVARAKLDAGDSQSARTRAVEDLTTAEALGYRPLVAEALNLLGQIEAPEDPKAAVGRFHRALVMAEATGHLEVVAEARLRLANVLGWYLDQQESAVRWADLGEAGVERVGNPVGLQDRLVKLRGDLAFKARRFDDAIAAHRALRDRVARRDPESIAVAEIDNQLAIDLAESGRLEEARVAFARALSVREALLGPDHPQTLDSLTNVAQLLRLNGKTEEALAINAQAIERRERVLGKEHLQVARALQNRVLMLSDLSRYDEALEVGERALRICEDRLGQDNPGLVILLQVVAEAAAGAGHFDRGRALARRAVELARSQGQDHPELGRSLYIQGAVEERADDCAAARPRYEAAIAAYDEAGKGDDPRLAFALDGAGRCARLAGDRTTAIARHRRSILVREAALGPDHAFLTDSLLGLGQALASGPPADRSEAIAALARGQAIAERIARPDIAKQFADARAAIQAPAAPPDEENDVAPKNP